MKAKILGLLAVGLLAGPMAAPATSISTNGTWYEATCFLGSDCQGEPFTSTATNPGASPWTFFGAATVTLVDGYATNSDQYALYDFGSLVGTTTASAPPSPSSCGTNPSVALADPSCGNGVFALGSGNHSLTIRLINSAAPRSGMFFRAEIPQVPEPGTLALLGLGLAGLGISRRRKSN